MSKCEHTTCLIFLIAIIAFAFINATVWLQIDTRPPRWDEASYLALSLRHHAALSSGGVGSLAKSLLKLDRKRPPLVPALAVPAYLLFGRGAEVAFAVNLLALVFLILAVYGLGAWLISRRCGLLAAFFVSVYPGVFSLTRLFLLDFCDMALAAIALYSLVRTESFSQKGPAVAFGVVMGLGLLCRAFFPIFLIGPLGISLYIAWRADKHNAEAEKLRKPGWQVNGGLALLACTAVAAPWYLTNMVPLVLRSLSATYGAEAVGYGPDNPLTVHAMVSYFINFTNIHPSPFGMMLFLLAVALLWLKRSSLQSVTRGDTATPALALALLLSSVVLPYLFFSTLPSQDIKNIIPVLPALAVITAWGLSLLQPPALRKSVVGGSIVWLLFQYWIGTYGLSTLPPQVGVRLGGNLPPLLLLQQGLTYPPGEGVLLPRRENWHIPDILSRITGGSVGPGRVQTMLRPAIVALLPDHPFFNMSNFDYSVVLQGLPVQIEHSGDPRTPEGKNYRSQLLEVDFVVTKTGDSGPQWLNVYHEEILTFLRSPDSGFVEIEPRFPLPDGSQAVLYAASSGPVRHDPPQPQYLAPVRFSDQVELLGYDLKEEGRTSQGRAFLVTYYWKALREVPNDYRIFVHVTEETGTRVIKGWDHSPARGRYPTSFWQPGTVIEDRGLYFLPADLPAGSYTLRLGLYLPAGGERLKVTQVAPGIPLDSDETGVALATLRIP